MIVVVIAHLLVNVINMTQIANIDLILRLFASIPNRPFYLSTDILCSSNRCTKFPNLQPNTANHDLATLDNLQITSVSNTTVLVC